jgi:cytochrome P450
LHDAERLTRPQAFIAGVIAHCAYNLLLHPLSSHPGPIIWRAIRLPYAVRALQGQLAYDMLKLHKRYGPIVRVAPNELALAYEGVWEDVQGASYNNEMPKWKPYYRVQPNQTEFIMAAPPGEHSHMRRALSYGFSDQTIRDMEFRMVGTLDKMIDRLLACWGGRSEVLTDQPSQEDANRGEAVVDISKWCNFLAFDMIGELAFGESYKCLDTAAYHPWVKPIVELTHYSGILAVLGFYPRFQGYILSVFGGFICRRMDFHQKHSRAALERRAARLNRTDLLSEALKQTQASQDVSLKASAMAFACISSLCNKNRADPVHISL